MTETARQLVIRTMSREDLNLAIDWAAQEGWNPGRHDAAPFWAADPEGYLIGELDEQAVAVISAVRYGRHFGFIGFYMVKPAYRGQGHGWTIWQAAMQHLQGRTVGLDGVVAQQDNYQRSGFALAHRNIRYAGVAASGASTQPQGSGRPGLVRLKTIPIAALLDYDRGFFPEPRESFLRAWIAQPGTLALGVIKANRLQGYGVIRPCRTGFKIGPLFADAPEIAEAIFLGLQQHLPAGEPFYLDVMASAPDALDLVARHGMQMVFETARMYLGPAPDLSPARTYGITSFELG